MHNSANDGYVDALRFFTWQFCMFVKVQPSILSLDNAALVGFRHKQHISCCVATKQHQVLSATNRCLVKSIRFCRHQIHLEWFLRVITNTWFCHLEQVCKCSDMSCFCRHKYIRKNVLTSSQKHPVLSPQIGLQMSRCLIPSICSFATDADGDVLTSHQKPPALSATDPCGHVSTSHQNHLVLSPPAPGLKVCSFTCHANVM